MPLQQINGALFHAQVMSGYIQTASQALTADDYAGLCLRHVLQYSMNTGTTTELERAPTVPSEVKKTHVRLNTTTFCKFTVADEP